MEIVRYILQNADALIALGLAAAIVLGFFDVIRERRVRRAWRADGYCGNPTVRRDYCRRHPGPPGGRCGANHPAELLIPGYPIVGSIITGVVAFAVLAWQPFATHVLPLLPDEFR